uniref:hypothetical protein n=1 Tax=Microbacterium proteolyticum TaxID=1572644 RepID=UPI002415B660|nr:hypothetical protein [Microbacterium proteolyticum]
MRQHTDDLLDALAGSFTRRVLVNVFHGTDRVATDLAFESWSLESDLDSAVGTSGSGVVVYPSVSGESLSPEGTKGVLSPFRARVELVMEVSAGGFRERVSLGLFRVVTVPEARDYTADVDGVSRVVSSRVKIGFASLAEDVRRRGFRFPEQPPQTDSCYRELRRITGMPVLESVPDAAISGNPTWEAKQGGRLDAVQKLADQMSATAVVNSAGAWVLVPDEQGEPVASLHLGERGTVLDVGNEIDTDTVYNVVVGQFEDDDRNPIYAIAEVEAGDLRPDSLYLETTRYYSSPFVKTQEAAESAVQAILALSTGAQVYDVPIQCHINPLIEVGDVVSLEGWVRPLVGRVVKVTLGDSALMNVTLSVRRAL